MRGIAYAVAAIAAVGIVIAIATMPADQATEATPEATVAEAQTVENAEVVAASATPAAAETQQLTLAVPEMHCQFACFPKVKEALESTDTVELVELGPQDEEEAVFNAQVIVTYKPGFDVDEAIALLSKEGFDDSELVQ